MLDYSPAKALRLDQLRSEIRAIEGAAFRKEDERLPFGIDAMDRRLCVRGLVVPALHEFAGASPGLNDDSAATLFLAGIAARCALKGQNVLWALSRRDLFAPSLAQAGLTPDKLIYADCRRDEDVLAVIEDGLRSGPLAAVVGEVGRAGLTATRRLQLAAEESGILTLLLRRWRRSGEDPLASPSAAMTRWRIACAPSESLPVRGVGRPCWDVELVRQRGGEPHNWIVEGTDAEGCLALPAKPSDRPDQGRNKGRRAA